MQQVATCWYRALTLEAKAVPLPDAPCTDTLTGPPMAQAPSKPSFSSPNPLPSQPRHAELQSMSTAQHGVALHQRAAHHAEDTAVPAALRPHAARLR